VPPPPPPIASEGKPALKPQISKIFGGNGGGADSS